MPDPQLLGALYAALAVLALFALLGVFAVLALWAWLRSHTDGAISWSPKNISGSMQKRRDENPS